MTTKKQEQQIEEHKEPDAKDVQIAQLNAKIENLEQQNLGLRNLTLQLKDILQKTDELITSVRYNIEHEKLVMAGVKLETLYRHVDSNNIALGEITKEWKKE